jgi:hypothetical protein
LEFSGGTGREIRSASGRARVAILQGDKIVPLLGVGPLRRGNGAAALVTTTTGAVDDKLSGV